MLLRTINPWLGKAVPARSLEGSLHSTELATSPQCSQSRKTPPWQVDKDHRQARVSSSPIPNGGWTWAIYSRGSHSHAGLRTFFYRVGSDFRRKV